MRKRFLISISLFGLALSLIFGVAVLSIFYWIEDRAYARQLEQLIQHGTTDQLVSNYSGPESGLPPDMALQVAELPLGQHEIEGEVNETHFLIKPAQGLGERHVAMIQVPESSHWERTLFVSLGAAIVLTIFAGLLLGSILVRHTVRPIEALVTWLKSPTNARQSPPQSSSEELQLLANALDAYVVQRETRVERERAFVNEASHELRTPISIIRGVCELADQAPLTDEAVGRVQRSVHRMEHTVEGLLCLAREDQRIDGIRFQEEWQSLFDEVRERYGERPSLDASLTWTPREPLAGRMIVLALGTLLRNAYEHAESSEIHVRLTKEALTVTDNGKGIATLPAIQLALRNLHPLPEGGLGLSLVERICRRMDWQFQLENREDGLDAEVIMKSHHRNDDGSSMSSSDQSSSSSSSSSSPRSRSKT